MKFGIDTFGCDHGKSGLGSYLLSFVKNLPTNSSHSFELFGEELDRYSFTSEVSNFQYTGMSMPDSITAARLWHIFRINNFLKKQKYNAVLYSAASNVIPFNFSTPGVAVINDLLSDQLLNNHDTKYFFLLKKGLKNVQKIIAASQCIKKKLVALGLDSNKIEVIHNGIDHSLFYPQSQINSDTVVIKPFAIKRPYFIYASRINGLEKKHYELVQAFSIFKKKTGLPHRLVFAGSDGKDSNIVHKIVESSEYASDIFLTGYFPHNSLPDLYSAADACIFPSVSEGVGLPVLEAMACGIPVACSRAGALTEIAGDNASYFDSENINEIAECMEQIVKDEKMRNKMITDGLNWVKRFSWEKTVAKTIEVLESVSK